MQGAKLMGSGSIDLHAAEWALVAQQIGLGGAVLLIITLSIGTAFIVRGPGLLDRINKMLEIVLKHRRETRRINEKLRIQQAELRLALENRKRNNGESGLESEQ